MIEYQRIILADSLRNEAFARALKKVVRKGMTIADIGSGTGFLSFIASRLGAKECHLYDPSELLDLSKLIARENGIMHCHFIRKHSTAVHDPPKADVVVAEVLGNFALEEEIIETMNDARRFLKPGGTVIPQSLRQSVAPMTSDRLWKEVTSWDRVGHGLTFASARAISCQNIYVRLVRPEELLPDSERVWDEVDFRQKNAPVRSAEVQWKMARDTAIYGFCSSWASTLVPGVTLSTSPSAPRTHWEQVYLPILRPVILKKGETLILKLHVDSRHAVRINVTWDIAVRSAAGEQCGRQHLDMRRGQIA